MNTVVINICICMYVYRFYSGTFQQNQAHVNMSGTACDPCRTLEAGRLEGPASDALSTHAARHAVCLCLTRWYVAMAATTLRRNSIEVVDLELTRVVTALRNCCSIVRRARRHDRQFTYLMKYFLGRVDAFIASRCSRIHDCMRLRRDTTLNRRRADVILATDHSPPVTVNDAR